MFVVCCCCWAGLKGHATLTIDSVIRSKLDFVTKSKIIKMAEPEEP